MFLLNSFSEDFRNCLWETTVATTCLDAKDDYSCCGAAAMPSPYLSVVTREVLNICEELRIDGTLIEVEVKAQSEPVIFRAGCRGGTLVISEFIAERIADGLPRDQYNPGSIYHNDDLVRSLYDEPNINSARTDPSLLWRGFDHDEWRFLIGRELSIAEANGCLKPIHSCMPFCGIFSMGSISCLSAACSAPLWLTIAGEAIMLFGYHVVLRPLLHKWRITNKDACGAAVSGQGAHRLLQRLQRIERHQSWAFDDGPLTVKLSAGERLAALAERHQD